MNIWTYFLDNYVMIYELIGLLILLKVSVHISTEMKNDTLLVVILLLLESSLFFLEGYAQTFDHYTILRPITTASLYSIYPLILIALLRVTAKSKLGKEKFWIIMIPEFVSVPIFFTSQWTRLVCFFTDDNRYIAGPIYRWPYIIFIFYIIVFAIYNYKYFVNFSSRNKLAFAYIIIGPILGALFYILAENNKDYSALFTSSIILYYIYIYIHKSKTDPLTSLLNRQSYYKKISSNTKAITAVVSVDMNDLKVLNDNFGHAAGDEALVCVSKILIDNCGKNANPYRIGGDEFMVLYYNTSEEDVVKSINKMKDGMEKTPYVCAFGYSMVKADEDIVDAIRISDKKMYENKAFLKKNNNK